MTKKDILRVLRKYRHKPSILECWRIVDSAQEWAKCELTVMAIDRGWKIDSICWEHEICEYFEDKLYDFMLTMERGAKASKTPEMELRFLAAFETAEEILGDLWRK